MGRDCRDAFLGLMKTCQRLGVSFWNYLGTRLALPYPARPRPNSLQASLTASGFAKITHEAARSAFTRCTRRD